VVGNSIYGLKTWVSAVEFIGVDAFSVYAYCGIAKNGTFYTIDDIPQVSQVEATTSTFQATVPGCVTAFPGGALVVLNTAPNTFSVLWYHGLPGTVGRVVIIGNQADSKAICAHRLNATDMVIGTLDADAATGVFRIWRYYYTSNTAGGVTGSIVKTYDSLLDYSAFTTMRIASAVIDYDGQTYPNERTISFLPGNSGITPSWNYDLSTHSFDPLGDTLDFDFAVLRAPTILGAPAPALEYMRIQPTINVVYQAGLSGVYLEMNYTDREGNNPDYMLVPRTNYPFLGFAETEALSSGASVTVKLGPIVTGLGSLDLWAGRVYHLWEDGAVTEKVLPPSTKIGLATSSSTIITKVYEG
jgi:hypothetical protein